MRRTDGDGAGAPGESCHDGTGAATRPHHHDHRDGHGYLLPDLPTARVRVRAVEIDEFALRPLLDAESLHSADALIVGVSLALLFRSPSFKAVWLLWPLVVWFSVLATANHFWLDVVGGIVVAGIGALAVAAIGRVTRHLRRRRSSAAPRASPAPWSASRSPRLHGAVRRVLERERRVPIVQDYGHVTRRRVVPGVKIGIVTDYYYPQLGGITEHVQGQATELARDAATTSPF